jgi:cell division septum initiation protein DivIVA
MAMSPAFQEQVPTPPTPPTPPTSPTIIRGPDGGFRVFADAPLTAREVQALRQRGTELSRQLTSATGRRNELANALEDAQGVNKQGIEQRIAQLDQRIMGIEGDIAENGRRLASAPASSLARADESSTVSTPFGLNAGQITGISIVGTIFVLFPLSIAMARNIWRRGSRQAAPAQSKESTERMERLEQAVDAIAIEIERVSEGQRFVTRLLTEGSAPALSVGQKAAEPVRLPDREALRASRESA